MSLAKALWSSFSAQPVPWFWILFSLAYEMCVTFIVLGFPWWKLSRYNQSLLWAWKPEALKVFQPRLFRQTRHCSLITPLLNFIDPSDFLQRKTFLSIIQTPDNFLWEITSRLQKQRSYSLRDLFFSPIVLYRSAALHIFDNFTSSTSWNLMLLWFSYTCILAFSKNFVAFSFSTL